MTQSPPILAKVILVAVTSGAIVGCAERVEFEPNRVAQYRFETEADVDLSMAQKSIQETLADLFGSPDEPRWPDFLQTGEYASVIRTDGLRLASGQIGRNDEKIEHGLFRKHCVACHGMTGDGAGPAAKLLYPYPRDFRRGTFKFKSTPKGSKPTRDDLKRTLLAGLPGTAMPSYRSLAREESFDRDLNALVDYVCYLAIRGEIEMELLAAAAFEADLDASQLFTEEEVQGIAKTVVQKWINADSQVLDVPTNLISDGFLKDAEVIARGKELFHSELTACATCHGVDGSGVEATLDYDEWTKDWTIRLGLDPKEEEQLEPLFALGALPPVKDIPRKFQFGAFRGGHEPEDIYRRIVGGIDGSPMPAVAMRPRIEQGLTQEQVWELVSYVRSLGLNRRLETSAVPVSKESAAGESVSREIAEGMKGNAYGIRRMAHSNHEDGAHHE